MEQPILPFAKQYRKYAQSITPFIQSTKTKNYSTVIFFFLVLSVFGWYAIRPTIQTILYLQREIKDKTETDKKMDEKINALIEANSVYENNQQLFPLLSEAVPKSPDALDIVSQMQNLATEQNVMLSFLQMGDIPLATQSALTASKNKNVFVEIPITCKIEGQYLSVVSFLKELVNIRRILTIQSMIFTPVKKELSSASESGIPATLELSIKLIAYYETK